MIKPKLIAGRKILLSTAILLIISCSAFGQKDYSVTSMISKIDSVIHSENIKLCSISFGTGNGGYWLENMEFHFEDFLLVTTESTKQDTKKTYYNMDRLRRFYIEDGVIVFVF